MEQEVLTDNQKRAIATIAQEPKLDGFYLSGGTALAAYYFKHRHSDDLDFFTEKEINIQFLHNFIEFLRQSLGTSIVRFEHLYDRNLFFIDFGKNREELKIEFTKYPFVQLQIPKLQDQIRVDSLIDIAVNKLMAMLDRFDPKDFVDLYFLLQKFELSDIRENAEKKFHTKIDPIFLGGELTKVRRIAALPRMIKPLTIDELKTFFASTAKSLSPYIFQ